jgi:integrase/recombinase XerC
MNSIVSYTDLKHSAIHAFDYLDVSETTKLDYQKRIHLFLKHIRKHGFDQNSYLSFKQFLKVRNDISVSTKNKYLITSRVLLKELHRQGVIPDITANVKTFTHDKKHKRTGLSENDMEHLVQHLNILSHNTSNTRLKVILGLLIYQGLRQCEVVRMTVEDLNLQNGTAFILGKSRDDKELVFLHPNSILLLQEYLMLNNVKSGFLFPSRLKGRALTTRSIRMLVQETLKQLGIKNSVHGFRHYFTSKLVKEYKGDLLEVQRYTRHRSLEMLQIYNDNVKHQQDLPRFYNTFSGLNLKV